MTEVDERVECAAKAIAEMYPPRRNKRDGYINPVWDMIDIEDVARAALTADTAGDGLDALLDSVGAFQVTTFEDGRGGYDADIVCRLSRQGYSPWEKYTASGPTRMDAIRAAVAQAMATQEGTSDE